MAKCLWLHVGLENDQFSEKNQPSQDGWSYSEPQAVHNGATTPCHPLSIFGVKTQSFTPETSGACSFRESPRKLSAHPFRGYRENISGGRLPGISARKSSFRYFIRRTKID
jgi:hypothetical protein